MCRGRLELDPEIPPQTEIQEDENDDAILCRVLQPLVHELMKEISRIGDLTLLQEILQLDPCEDPVAGQFQKIQLGQRRMHDGTWTCLPAQTCLR